MPEQLTFTITVRSTETTALVYWAERLRKSVYPVRNAAISHGNGALLFNIDERFTLVCPTCQELGADWKDFLHEPVEKGCRAPLEHHDEPHD